MINLTKLLCGKDTDGDWLRYPPNKAQVHRRPVVVWNTTRRCGLRCMHCYSDSENKKYKGELSTEEGMRLIDDLAWFGIPVLLFSGGEPLMRKDIFRLGRYASVKNIRTVISTNGTLINSETASMIKEAGFSYAGISIDGIGEHNDRFRGKKGAFKKAVGGIKNCMEKKIKTGLRFTITKYNYKDVKDIFRLAREEGIKRICFYHLVYAGRENNAGENDLSHKEKRKVIDYICGWAAENRDIDILTVDNHTDSVYIYQKTRDEYILKLLKVSGGNSSGEGIACIDSTGNVHPDQFWTFYSMGNVRRRRFSDIWADSHNSLILALRGDRAKYIKGKCALCAYFEICNGNFRVRAYAAYGDIWAEDPACYLTKKEIRQ